MWARLKRKLYPGDRPSRFTRWINRGVAALHASGLGPEGWVTLEIAGRKSGRLIAFPLVMTSLGGERYLVSMLGNEAAWVRNLRAAEGAATLRRGGRERVRLVEVEPAARAEILKAYLRAAPGARPHIPIDVEAPVSAFAALADRFPVFRVVGAAAG